MQEERYNRQLILKDFGPEAQQKLTDARVLVVGAGGLGVPVLTYLNAMGVGTLGIVDNDVVALSNLHRQVLYKESDVGILKVKAAIGTLHSQNKTTHFQGYETFLTKENAVEIIADYDVVIDATDNFPTRYLINDACVLLNKPFVYGALHGFEGQVSVFNYQDGPTYRCLYPTMPKAYEVPNCNEHGVLGIVPGIVGNFQALEAVKILTGVGQVLSGKLLLFDGLGVVFQKIKFSRNPENVVRTALETNYDFDCEIPIQSISPTDFMVLNEKKKLQIIDVRTLAEYEKGHLADSLHIPLQELSARSTEINKEIPAYFLCQSGLRSQKAIASLQALMPTSQLIDVSGGMNQLQLLR